LPQGSGGSNPLFRTNSQLTVDVVFQRSARARSSRRHCVSNWPLNVECIVRIHHGWLTALAAGLALSACGGSEGPAGPALVPLPSLSIAVAPNPITATLVRATEAVITIRIAADITITESAGTGGRVNEVAKTITFTHATDQGGTLPSTASIRVPADLSFAPFGRFTQTVVDEIGFSIGETVTWRYEVSGIDSQGRPFIAASANVPVIVPPTGG
jgi:hypothetical protein